jgi:kynureninase
MNNMDWDLDRNLDAIRKEFPILTKCVYLISNSLGAVPHQVRKDILAYYDLWSCQGVSAWSQEWWDLARDLGDRVASLLHAEKDSVAMMTNATQAHWIALSTKFLSKDQKRTKIIMTDHDFPSSLYAVQKISEFMDWEVQVVQSFGKPGIDVEKIISLIDEQTLFVATSHVYFKTAYVQDIAKIVEFARQFGALTVIDGYHAPGCIPVDLSKLGVDFYIGGCLKWLCGGPGNAFLYIRPELASHIQPQLTGWLAHKSPFSFSRNMEYTHGSYKFMSGTPPIPSLYTARAGLEIIDKIGVHQIRQKSIYQTRLIIKNSKKRNFQVFSPEDDSFRGGAVSVNIPNAFQVKQALEARKFKVDYRKGKNSELDVIRIGPHFYTSDDEIHSLFQAIDTIYATGEYKSFPVEITHVT